MNSNRHTIWKPNPRAESNAISAMTFSYLIPIFWRNYKQNKHIDDIYEPMKDHAANRISNKLESVWKVKRRKYKKWALHRALLSVFGLEFMIYGILTGVLELIAIVTPSLFIGKIILFFTKDQMEISRSEAYMYVGFLIVSLFINRVVSHPIFFGLRHVSMKVRIACSSLVYRKILRLNKAALRETSVGQIVNILSNDVGKFNEAFILAHYIWVSPLQCGVGTYLLYLEIGLPALYGIAFLLLFIPIQILLGNVMSSLRAKTASKTDERIRLMNEIITAIQVIKMYTWEVPFSKLIASVRRQEMNFIRKQTIIVALLKSCEKFVTKTSIFISILAYILMGEEINAQRIFVVTALYNVMRTVITLLFCLGIASIAEVHISLKRLEVFLDYDEKLTKHEEAKTNLTQHHSERNPRVPMVTFANFITKWSDKSIDNALENIDLRVNENTVVAIIGPVGSGKTSLFNAILKELPIIKGEMVVQGEISYCSQEPWLFCDNIQNNILFDNDYNEERYKKVCTVCCLNSDFSQFPSGDKTLIGDRGITLSGGQKARINLARCIYKKADIYLLDDPLSAVDNHVGKVLVEDCIGKFLRDKICILNTHQLQHLQNVDNIVILNKGVIVGQGTYAELQTSELDFAKLLNALEENGDDEQTTMEKEILLNQSTIEDLEYAPETAGGLKIGASLYWQFIKSGGPVVIILSLFMLIIVSQASGMGADYYSAFWVNYERDVAENKGDATLNRDTVITIYIILIVAMIILSIAQSVSFYIYLINVSVKLHNRIFHRVSKATMTFFNNNPSGRILNRFSRDIGIMDEVIPAVFHDVVDIFFRLIAAIVLTSIIDPYILIPSFILLLSFYGLRNIFLHTCRSAKRKEAAASSSIFGQVTDTINGLSTIRASSAENALIKEFDERQDFHSSSWFMYMASSCSVGYFLDLLTVTFIAVVIFGLLALRQASATDANMGLIITQYVGLLGLLQWGMKMWGELEVNMTSTERVLEYTKLEGEPSRRMNENIKRNWPEHGQVQFENVLMKYNPQDQHVLKNLSFVIKAGEKVGIVGRTGAGKSSIIAALFQLYDLEGRIIIDDLDTRNLPLEVLRTKLAIIPQEPVMFAGSMRKNLDPFDEYNDDILWSALEQVELKNVIANMPGGLVTQVSNEGSNFSVGQKQLVCLARAIVRGNKILVLDEATANVDPYTDALIQKTIKKQFADNTVLTIAHRLHTVMDSDKILVMSDGCAIEFDHPHNLLQNDSMFKSMVEVTDRKSVV